MTLLYIVLGVAAYILFGIAVVAFLSRKRFIGGIVDDVEFGIMVLAWPVLIILGIAVLLVFKPMFWIVERLGRVVIRVGKLRSL